MKRTARQLKVQDIIDGRFGVTNVTVEQKLGATFVKVELILANGERTSDVWSGNAVLEVARADAGEVDPLNNPYWWGVEREQEMLEDKRAYEREEAAERAAALGPGCGCAYLNPCWGHRVEAARNVAHRGATAVFRELHRAHND